MQPDFSSEYRVGAGLIIGTDEVGRGCIAGPVVAAAVVIPESIIEFSKKADWSAPRSKPTPKEIRAFLSSMPIHDDAGDCNEALFERPWWSWLNDSKKLNPEFRELLARYVRRYCVHSLGFASPEDIDDLNILRASMLAMRRAVKGVLEQQSERAIHFLVDGHLDPFSVRYGSDCLEWKKTLSKFTVETLVQGDSRSMSIAAASIVAKVYRDAWMARLDKEYPGYGFADHKGYLAPQHLRSVKEKGPCRIHRFSFAPISEYGTRHEVCSDGRFNENRSKEDQQEQFSFAEKGI